MQPLTFHPILKRLRWGGRRLGGILGKPIGAENDYAESWELADHGGDQSVVVDGPHVGRTLQELVRDANQALFGRHAGLRQFPLLVKFLDANDRLSLQVHPDDEKARHVDPDENGKTEAWVIIDCQPGSRIFAGLRPGIDRPQLERHIRDGTIEETLHEYQVQRGDCILIPAGTVHAIGAGILLAEIQQQSDLTYRLHDWGWRDANGNPRELHIARALTCIDFDRGPMDPVTARAVGGAGDHQETLVASEFFVIHRHRSETEFRIQTNDQFQILMVIDGTITLWCDTDSRELPVGSTVLVPAAASEVRIRPHTTATILRSHLP